ncbi:hypothetical protein [Haladaptatus salinisoli]|uniref:hypothetical protein n=1 Tax=Haladaptatus salinisoli TaxID=2884876 RepID=UPI001D0B1159|nr:hypothetical protein [Haladaptatus salinisoli]
MLTPPQSRDDDDGRRVERLYGEPQHETRGRASEQELYGEPQHDVSDGRFPPEFDPDLGYALDWLESPIDAATVSRRRPSSLRER